VEQDAPFAAVFGSGSAFGAGTGFAGFTGVAPAAAAATTDGAAATGEEEAGPEEECQAEFKPIVHLDEVETTTGEEHESALVELCVLMVRICRLENCLHRLLGFQEVQVVPVRSVHQRVEGAWHRAGEAPAAQGEQESTAVDEAGEDAEDPGEPYWYGHRTRAPPATALTIL
jgi:hypothetical protein